MPDVSPNNQLPAQVERRSFVGSLAAMASGAALSLLGCSPEDRSEGALVGAASSQVVEDPIAMPRPSYRPYRGEPLDFPRFFATYIPSGYFPVGELVSMPDGFRGGANELCLTFGTNAHREGIFRRIHIFGTSSPQAPFGGTLEAAAEEISLGHPVFGEIVGSYYGGAWNFRRHALPEGGREIERFWDTSHIHALVFAARGLSFGIRGGSQAGISRAELIKIAEGIEQVAA